VVAELAKVYAGLPDAPEPRSVERFYGKYPSDVCQRVGVLGEVLKEILVARQE